MTTAGPARIVPVATTRGARLLGLALLGAPQAGAGLLIPGCRAVHTIGMRFAVDLHFLDAAGGTISVRHGVPARRFAFERSASAVLEVPSGGRG
jgi:uncharacterized membrane protein (UPF0127 family)